MLRREFMKKIILATSPPHYSIGQIQTAFVIAEIIHFIIVIVYLENILF